MKAINTNDLLVEQIRVKLPVILNSGLTNKILINILIEQSQILLVLLRSKTLYQINAFTFKERLDYHWINITSDYIGVVKRQTAKNYAEISIYHKKVVNIT